MTQIINGKEIAFKLREKLKENIIKLKNEFGSVPGLAVVQVGDNSASSVYVKAKTKNAKEVGIEVIDYHLEDSTTQNHLLQLINTLNKQDNVNGTLVFEVHGGNSSCPWEYGTSPRDGLEINIDPPNQPNLLPDLSGIYTISVNNIQAR